MDVITKVQTDEIYEAMGKVIGDIYIKWYNENAVTLIDQWADNKGYTRIEQISKDELVSHMAFKFAEWIADNN